MVVNSKMIKIALVITGLAVVYILSIKFFFVKSNYNVDEKHFSGMSVSGISNEYTTSDISEAKAVAKYLNSINLIPRKISNPATPFYKPVISVTFSYKDKDKNYCETYNFYYNVISNPDGNYRTFTPAGTINEKLDSILNKTIMYKIKRYYNFMSRFFNRYCFFFL